MRAVRDAALYGSLAFGLGFLFGALREVLLKPALGDAAGTVIEFAAVTACVVVLGVRLGRRWAGHRWSRLARGIGGVAVLLALESTLALGILGQTPEKHLAAFDVRAGALFPFGLLAMALAPALVHRR